MTFRYLTAAQAFARLRAAAHAIAIALGSIFAIGFATTVQAQVFPAIDANGVDVVTGEFTWSHNDVVIGDPAQGGLAYNRSEFGDGRGGSIQADTATTCRVVIGRYEETFTSSQGTCLGTFTSNQQRGARLSYYPSQAYYEFTAPDGSVAIFARVSQPVDSEVAYLTTVTALDGLVTRYSYYFSPLCTWDPENWESCPYNPIPQVRGQLGSISNSLGYQLRFQYGPNGLTNVWGINLAEEYCSGSDCTQSWPSASYSYDNGSTTVRPPAVKRGPTRIRRRISFASSFPVSRRTRLRSPTTRMSRGE